MFSDELDLLEVVVQELEAVAEELLEALWGATSLPGL
jgi:hypothetical protein